MNTTDFHPAKFFDFSDFQWRDIFNDIDLVWEILPKLAEYVADKVGNKHVVLGTNSAIDKIAFIEGRALIGANTEISHGAFLRGNVIIGRNCHIGHAVELKNCLVLDNTHIAHLNYVGDSIIGNDVNIAGGAMLANLRFDKKPVAVSIGNNKIATHLTKFGAVIGDKSHVGANSVLNPGTVLGKGTIVYPLVAVRGFHQAGEVVKK